MTKPNPTQYLTILLMSAIVLACSNTYTQTKDKSQNEKTEISIGFFIFDDAAVDIANDISGGARLHFKNPDGNNKYVLSNNPYGKIDSALFYGDKLLLDKEGKEIVNKTIPESVFINNRIEKTASLEQHNLHWNSVPFDQLIDAHMDVIIYLCKKKNAEVRFVMIKCYDSTSVLSDRILKIMASKNHGNEIYDAIKPEEYAKAKIKYFNNNPDRTFIKKVLKNLPHPERYEF